MKLFLIVLIFITFSCGPKKNQQGEDINKGMETLSLSDPRMKHAIQLAQDSLSFFADAFEKFHDKTEYNFFVKTDLNKDNDSEPIWAKPYLMSDKKFQCVLDSNPRTIAGYKFGDTIQISFESIEDFMIILGDSVVGNYLQKELKKPSAQ